MIPMKLKLKLNQFPDETRDDPVPEPVPEIET